MSSRKPTALLNKTKVDTQSKATATSSNFLKPTASSAQKSTPRCVTGNDQKTEKPKSAVRRLNSGKDLEQSKLESIASSSQQSTSGCSNLNDKKREKPAVQVRNSTFDLETQYEDAYNDYLLAMMYQQIAKKQSREVKQKMSEQLAAQAESLYKDKIELQRLEMQQKIAEEEKNIDANTNKLQVLLLEFKKKCEEWNLEESMSLVVDVLKVMEDRVVLQNILVVDADQVDNQLSSLSAELMKLLRSCDNQDKIHELAEKLQTTLCLKEELIKKETLSKQQMIDLAGLIMKALSDHFAAQQE